MAIHQKAITLPPLLVDATFMSSSMFTRDILASLLISSSTMAEDASLFDNC